MQPGASSKQTRWKAAVAVVAYALLLRCGLMDLQERLLTLGCVCLTLSLTLSLTLTLVLLLNPIPAPQPSTQNYF